MIKRVILQFPLLFICSIALAQKTKQSRSIKYVLDPEGKKTSTSFMNLHEKYPDNAMAFRITADSGRVYQFNSPRYSAYKIDHEEFRKKLETLTDKVFSKSTTFIIYYNYKDDVCSEWYRNNMNNVLIKERKEYHDPFKVYIEKTYSNSVYLVLYENGISLSNNPQSKEEYFFSDRDNFFKKTIFRNPTVCGSFSLIKYDGNTLVYNGETVPDWFASHLKPEIWNSIFKVQ